MKRFAGSSLLRSIRFRCSAKSARRVLRGGMGRRRIPFPVLVLLPCVIGSLCASKVFALSFSAASTLQTGNGDVSVAVGDVNGDGRVDLVSASTASFRVLIGNGNGTFQSAITRGTLVSFINNNAIVKLADVNDDAKTDVVIFSGGLAGVIPGVSGLIDVFLGNGDGTFQASIETTISVAGFPMDYVVADFNGDDYPEIVVFNQILTGNGDGTFQPAVPFSGGGAHVLVADFNGDHLPDLVGLYPNDGVSLLAELRYSEGNGDGTFDSAVVHSLAGGWLERDTCAVTGDFNRDGQVDVAYSYTGYSASNKGYRVLLGTGTGSFQSPIETALLTSYGVVQFVAGDFDGDGMTDVVTGNQGNTTPVANAGYFKNGYLDLSQPLTVFRSVGGGSLRSKGTLPLAKLSQVRMQARDLNGDGKTDVVLVGTTSGTTSVYTLINSTKPNPTVSITGGRTFSTTGRKVMLKGRATDTKGELDRVEVKAGRAAYTRVKGIKSWTYTARPRPGRNLYQFRAVDVSGVFSGIVRVTVFRR